MIDSRIMRELASAIADAGSTVVHSSEHTATVTRVDLDGTVWVTIPGGADETPASTSLVSVSQGDTVKVLIANGRATVTGNATSPAANVTELSAVEQKADAALTDADVARIAAEEATLHASIAGKAAASAQGAAADANESATSASRSAASALMQLAVVQDVAGVLAWIQSHGSYAPTQDVALVEGKTYYELVGTDYVPVTTPVVEDIGSYYELSLDSSVTDYVMAHLAVTSEGLWVLPGGSGYVASTDVAVVPDKLYYALDSGSYVLVTPSSQGWYEYDAENVAYYESQDASIDLGKTYYELDDGAYVPTGTLVPSARGWYEHDPATGYKSLYGPDGHRLYDGSGRLVKTEGESIDFSSTRPQHIGGEDAYILYYDGDDDGMPDSIAIGGENVTIGSKPLAELLADMAQQQGSVEAIESFVRIVTDGVNPRMVLGSASSAIEARMTNEGLGFYAAGSPDDEPITSIYVDQQTGQGVLEVANAVVVSELRLEHWAWTPRKNGNLALKWIDELVDPDPEPDPGGDDEGDGGGE